MKCKCSDSLVQGYFEADDLSSEQFTVCAKCGEAIEKKPLPKKCTCMAKLEWWNLKRSTWYQPDLSVKNDIDGDVVWISGDFDGHYAGVEDASGGLHRVVGNHVYK